MKGNLYRRASIISAVLGLVLILVIYIMLSSVDLIFIKDQHEIYRMEDVGVFSDLTVDVEKVEGQQDLEYTYTSGEETKAFDDSFDFRIEIVKTTLINLITFKWEPHDQVIVMTAK